MTQQQFTVAMTCGGCSKAVNAVLSKTEGVSNIQIDLAQQLVTVESTIPAEDVLKAIQKTGMFARLTNLTSLGKKASIKQ